MNGKFDKMAAYVIFPLLVFIFLLTSLTSTKGSHNPTAPILIIVGLLTLIILDVIAFKNKNFINRHPFFYDNDSSHYLVCSIKVSTAKSRRLRDSREYLI